MLYAKLFVKRRRARGDSSRRPANSAALREKFISTERSATGQGFSMKRRSSRCATVDGFAYCLGGFAADHETVGASSAFLRLTGARRRRVSSLTACRVAVSPQSPLRGLTRRRTQTPRVARTRKRGKPHVEARKGSAHPLEALIWLRRNGSRVGIRCGTLRLCARRDTHANEVSRRARKLFRASTDGRAVFVSHHRCAFVSAPSREPERVRVRRRCRAKTEFSAPAARSRFQPRSARSRGGAVSCSRDSAHVQGRLSRRERIAFPAEALCGRAIRGDRAPRSGSALPQKTLKTFDAWGAVSLRDLCVKNLCGLCVETCSGRAQETFAECAKHSFRDTPLVLRRGSVFF